jgi:hypothetical protein
VLQNAYDSAEECTIFELAPGQYCNKYYYKNVETNTEFNNKPLVKGDGKNNIHWIAQDSSNKPLLTVDGWSAFKLKNSIGMAIKNLEIQGPALKITGAEASSNRERITGKDTNGCG